MENNYNNLRAESNETLDQTKKIIVNALGIDLNIWKIEDTTFDEDTRQASDIKIVNDEEALYFAHRVRKAEIYETRYFNEFTVRAVNKRGFETELSKIMRGCVDMMFYAFHTNGRIGRWGLGDADAFRNIFHWDEANEIWIPDSSIICGMKSNEHDSDNDFMWFDVPSIERYLKRNGMAKFIMAHSPGYFEDTTITSLPKSDGTKIIMYKLKNKEDRVDGT